MSFGSAVRIGGLGSHSPAVGNGAFFKAVLRGDLPAVADVGRLWALLIGEPPPAIHVSIRGFDIDVQRAARRKLADRSLAALAVDEVRQRLRERCRQMGGAEAFAGTAGVSRQFVIWSYAGPENPQRPLLDALALERVDEYREKDRNDER
jgi:hypothetical protein